MSPFRNIRRGMTLLELLIATSIMAIMAGVLGGLALSVQMQSRHSQGHGEAVQHARVILDRLQRLINESNVSEQFPGFHVYSETIGTYTFPDTLIVWSPPTVAVDPDGLPRWNEVVVVCADPQNPNILWEMRMPDDSRTVPALTDTTSWRSELIAFKQSNSTEKTELTSLLRTASATTNPNIQEAQRAVIRFDLRQRPDAAQWTEYQNGARAWEDLDWAQGIYGTKTGLRQTWCRIEIQLLPGSIAMNDDAAEQSVLTFFGSAAVYHELHK